MKTVYFYSFYKPKIEKKSLPRFFIAFEPHEIIENKLVKSAGKERYSTKDTRKWARLGRDKIFLFCEWKKKIQRIEGIIGNLEWKKENTADTKWNLLCYYI